MPNLLMIKKLVVSGTLLSLDNKEDGVLKVLLKLEVYGNVVIVLILKLDLDMKPYITFSSEDPLLVKKMLLKDMLKKLLKLEEDD